jgi:hypothetical protein
MIGLDWTSVGNGLDFGWDRIGLRLGMASIGMK